MTRLRLLPSGYGQRTRWTNDGGWTREIARMPAARDQPLDWRLSIAEIETDGPFSHFPGITRDLVLLAGKGMSLEIGTDPEVALREPLAHVRFDGGAATRCRLHAGPTRDFNLMTRTVWGSAGLRVLTGWVRGTTLQLATGETVLLHVVDGFAQVHGAVRSVNASTGETLWIDAPDDAGEDARRSLPATSIAGGKPATGEPAVEWLAERDLAIETRGAAILVELRPHLAR